MDGDAYLTDVRKRFRDIRKQCERAIEQVSPELWSRRLDPESNSIVTLLLHLSGNMRSRWTDFLTADGEKPDRERDSEFEDPESLSHEDLLSRWSRAWGLLFDTLESLTDADLARTVTIRSQPHTVIEAIDRQLTHYASHAGQIVFLAKHLAGPGWNTLSIPRRGSAGFNAAMRKKTPRTE
jgi:uncharacterized damage-inducible protein DinB